ncbi:uncharacterized protein Z518_09305 [Rhinocladiella mackenziei CBS 650.93]|uniref:Transcriptional regulatory protein DEP1 n=1 Tax=Rhinocladiella mackenziei CBS 650.93 TaxID=1442369 RepID=A0A0D2I6Y9_9EURO|nr:uncharacterized protein Z518_09305 [Rhinocladiella mackenziei CBS 650.93]KIX01579.1 hypothetical protein Z518_09305 [Rhinocladiella mackenziei CBS 650.93]
MDSAADSLLALSNTAAAIAAHGETPSDDDRSSSLSELDENLEDGEDGDMEPAGAADGDSEAETERLQVTPENLAKQKPFQISPSKLAHRKDVDMRPEIESITESAVSSPISSHGDSEIDAVLSDGPEADEEVEGVQQVDIGNSPNKRKREESESDVGEAPRSQRRRTGSVESEDEKSEPETDVEDRHSQPSREPTMEPEPEIPEHEDEEPEELEEEPKEAEKVDTSEDSKDKTRSRPRRKAKGDVAQEPQPEDDDEAEAAEDSDAVDENDVDVTAKSEEEQAKRMAAMEALTALERHFATLRDRLYDERIAGINHELALLSEAKPSHPELLRQLEAVQKYRDEKFEVEQKLLVYKIGALKNKAVAERSQIHSQYFQTVRDLRERHLERISEHFYRIQRDRFKADSSIPNFSIPFAERRSQHIIQQTAYNKEVSILSGIAKYVGFPAAPELTASKQKEVQDDVQKMGARIYRNLAAQRLIIDQIRPIRATQRSVPNSTGAQISGPQAEEQFLEQTPWANPQHPIHRLNRQNSNRSPLNEFLTPANQQRTTDGIQPTGSASTIVDPSAQGSAMNTPHDGRSSTTKLEAQTGSSLNNYRLHSTSPLDARRAPSNAGFQIATDSSETQARDPNRALGSSPLTSRAQMSAGSPPRTNSTRSEKASRLDNDSPFRHARDSAITAGSGFSGTGRFSIR